VLECVCACVFVNMLICVLYTHTRTHSHTHTYILIHTHTHRAKQLMTDDAARAKSMGILLHGDAAFAGQVRMCVYVCVCLYFHLHMRVCACVCECFYLYVGISMQRTHTHTHILRALSTRRWPCKTCPTTIPVVPYTLWSTTRLGSQPTPSSPGV
jgi:hypothetical protein